MFKRAARSFLSQCKICFIATKSRDPEIKNRTDVTLDSRKKLAKVAQT